MNTKNLLFVIIGILTLGLSYLLFFKKKEEATTPAPTPAPTIPVGGVNCYQVPEGLAPFSSPLVPPNAQTYLGFSDVQWTDDLQQRILGFFQSIDVQPTESRMKFFGKQAILDYLNTSTGQLPHWDVVKGALRCSTSQNYTQTLI